MKEIENILQKIDLEVKNQIEEIQKSFEQKKVELETKYKNLLEEQKNLLDKEFDQNLQIAKKRIYTEKFVEYNKKIEEIKNEIFNNLLDKIKKSIFDIDKNEYYKMLKNILLKNLFSNEHNYIIFDNSEKLTKNEKYKLIKEIEEEISKSFPSTKIEIKEKVEESIDFGIKIVAKDKLKEFSLNTIIDIIKPLCEEEINNLFLK